LRRSGAPVADRDCDHAAQPPPTTIAGPGAMIKATALFAAPSTVSCPSESELIVRFVLEFGRCQPLETAYHSGSPAESTSLSSPSVRQGSRPTAGAVQKLASMPSFEVPKFPGASGQGR
jgi:hypothetical protein